MTPGASILRLGARQRAPLEGQQLPHDRRCDPDRHSATVPRMACRGYFLALDGPCIALLLSAVGDDRRVIEVIKELDMTDVPDECGVDKAWDGIHRCLTEGRLGGEDGSYPLNAVVLGGLPLHQGEDYVVSYNTPAEVREVTAALADHDMTPFLAKFWALDPDDYGAVVDQRELDYLTSNLREITAFYQRAAQADWASVFVVDQLAVSGTPQVKRSKQ